MRTAARLAATTLAWTAGGLVACLALALLVPTAFGWRPMTVLTGSMSPAIRAGDVVLDEPVHPLQARPGDIVSFPDPSRGGATVTHRLVALSARGDRVEVRTRGDANTAEERWSVRADATLGRVALRVPRLGRVTLWARSPPGRIGLLVLPAGVLAVLALGRIWRPRRLVAGEGP